MCASSRSAVVAAAALQQGQRASGYARECAKPRRVIRQSAPLELSAPRSPRPPSNCVTSSRQDVSMSVDQFQYYP